MCTCKPHSWLSASLHVHVQATLMTEHTTECTRASHDLIRNGSTILWLKSYRQFRFLHVYHRTYYSRFQCTACTIYIFVIWPLIRHDFTFKHTRVWTKVSWRCSWDKQERDTKYNKYRVCSACLQKDRRLLKPATTRCFSLHACRQCFLKKIR